MGSKQPLVTVISTVYNNGKYIIEALQTVQQQTYKNIQHILIDDCSKDNSIEIVEEWIKENNYPCEFVKHEKNWGLCKTLNDALGRAKGKYVTMVSDDLFLPNKIEYEVSILEVEDKDIGVLYSDCYIIDEYNSQKNETALQAFPLYPHMPQGNIFEELIKNNFIPALSTIIRRECFEKVGYYDESLAYEDWDMWLRIALFYKFKYVNKIHSKYRVHSSSMWNTKGAALLESTLQSHYKFLGIDEKVDKIIKERIVQGAEHIYMMNGKESSRWLKNKFKIDRKFSSAILYISARLNIDYNKIIYISRLIKGNRV